MSASECEQRFDSGNNEISFSLGYAGNLVDDVKVKLKSLTHRDLTAILLIMSVVILFLLPFAGLFALKGNAPSINDFIKTFEDVGVSLRQILSVGLIQGSIHFVGGLFVIILLFVGASLVFDLDWRRNRIWGRKTLLHKYFGYYIMIELLFPMFVWDLLGSGWHPRLWGTFNAPILLFTLFLLSFSLLLAHIITNMPLKIGGESNVGYFIISIYLSYAFFSIMAQGFSIFGFWSFILDVNQTQGTELVPIYANAFFVLSLPSIFAGVASALDSFADRYLNKRALMKSV